MKILGVETRDGYTYEARGHCHICGHQPDYLSLEQLALRPGVPGPWMVRVQHMQGGSPDHLLPAENIAFIRLG